MMEPRPIEVAVRGRMMRGLQWGADDAPAVVAMHGWLDNAASFTPIASMLVASGRRLLAFDLPGHGRSDHRSPDAHYHYVNYAIDVAELVGRLGLTRCRLMGHSMGAGVSIIAAAGLGDRVERIDLIEGLGPFTTPADQTAETFEIAAASAARIRTRERGVYTSIDDAVRRKQDALGAVSRESAHLLVERSLREVEGGWVFGDDPRLSGRSFIRFTEEQFHSFLAALTCPVALVTATDGLDYPERAMKARIDAIADVEWTVLDGGHHLHMETPAAVAAALGYGEAS